MIRAVDVSVLLPVLNEGRHLRDAAAGMFAQTYEGTMEFLFIDGGSTDGSREIIAELVRRDGRARLIENPGVTTPRALNRGLQAAAGEFVVRIDAHARYGPEYIALGVARLRHGDVTAVSGPALPVGYDRWSRRVALALGSPLGVGGASFRRTADNEFEVDSGFTGLWRRSVLIANGGWEDDWVGDEDFELAFRLRNAGGRIICVPELAAKYAPRNSVSALASQYWTYGRGRVRTSRRHPESLRPSQVLPFLLVCTLFLATPARQPLVRPARAGMLVYILALLAESARAVRRGAAPTDAAALPAVFMTMHLAYGFGVLAGMANHGVPIAALAQVGRTLAQRMRQPISGTN